MTPLFIDMEAVLFISNHKNNIKSNASIHRSQGEHCHCKCKKITPKSHGNQKPKEACHL